MTDKLFIGCIILFLINKYLNCHMLVKRFSIRAQEFWTVYHTQYHTSESHLNQENVQSLVEWSNIWARKFIRGRSLEISPKSSIILLGSHQNKICHFRGGKKITGRCEKKNQLERYFITLVAIAAQATLPPKASAFLPSPLLSPFSAKANLY